MLVILAHVGGFLPAAFASVPRVDQLFTRINNDDHIESNASTFMMEVSNIPDHLLCIPLGTIVISLSLDARNEFHTAKRHQQKSGHCR
jgi:hypothetical protein